MEMKYYVRWKIVDEEGNVTGVWISCHLDIKVKMDVFNELTEKGLVLPHKPLEEYEVSNFDDSFGNWKPPWRSVEEAVEIQIREEEDHQRSKIVREVDYGTHIPLKCKICGAMFSTKNIAPIGCRSLFYGRDYNKAMECDAAGHELSDLEPQIKGGE